MAYTVEFKPSASREFKKLPTDIRHRIAKKINSLGQNPRPQGVETLQGGERMLRIRVGDYRIIYQVHDRVLLVLVVRIGHRREVYR